MARSGVYAQSGDADREFLAVDAVHHAGLPGAGGDKPASGAVPAGTRAEPAGRGLCRQLFLPDVGHRQLRFWCVTETIVRALETRADRVAVVPWREPVPVRAWCRLGVSGRDIFRSGRGRSVD